MACFSDDIAIVGAEGVRVEGHDVVRDHYEREFKVVPDGRCDLQTNSAHDERGVAESVFHGTMRDGTPVRAVGAEIVEFADGRISEIRDYHRRVDADGGR